MSFIRITTIDPKKNKEVMCGVVDTETRQYLRSVNRDHFCVKHHGYGIQVDVLTKLLKMDVKDVLLTTQAGTKLLSKFTDWATKGKKDNLGNGEQIFLDSKLMQTL